MSRTIKETGTIFGAESVPAILDNRKTMTRRTRGLKEINEPDLWEWFGFDNSGRYSFRFKPGDRIVNVRCPYGQVGDRLWVKETWATIKLHDNTTPSAIKPSTWAPPIWYKATEDDRIGLREINPWPEGNIGKWRPSIFMPRWASRILLETTKVRVERLQEISEEDAKAEGCPGIATHKPYPRQYRDSFEVLWDSLNAKRGYGWTVNPFVWVISFRRLQ